ncbi:MAG TPA: transketolase [Candidatus Hydrogenedentes bacterium]|nr:transketolase [Candidatus Hydrogenedentota bacterium]
MDSNNPDVKELEAIARELRVNIVDMIYTAGSGHAGGSLSICEILSVLYYAELNVDPANPRDPERDRCILSKGHGAPALYAVLARKGFFPSQYLDTLRQIGSKLQGHPDMNKVPGVDISSGSLGMGISFGIGTALGARLNNLPYRTYVITGCGELDEGQNWEGLMCAAKYGLDNLVALVDYNRVQLDGTNEEIMPLAALDRKLAAFNWHVIACDGHSIPDLMRALEEARGVRGRPSVIIANTVKGKGVSFMEHRHEWHGKEISDEDYEKAIEDLKGAQS